MNLVVVGINHKTAPVALRERLAFAKHEMSDAYESLGRYCYGSIIVSTCNRTELYVHLMHESTEAINSLTAWLAHFKQLNPRDLKRYLYVHTNDDALRHWLRVASGLDSMILGEPQIFGQIKRAVEQAKLKKGLSAFLHWQAMQVFAAAKQVRHETAVGNQAVSLGFAAAKLVTQIFDQPQQLSLLLVAAGEMNRLVAQHMLDLGVRHIMVCNRSIERAKALSDELSLQGHQASYYGLDAIPKLLHQADVVSCCTGSLQAVLLESQVKAALKKRRYRPQLIVDLAVPRDVETQVGRLDGVYLYSVDDLQHVIEGNLEKRRQAAVEAEILVSQLVVDIQRRQLVREVGADIRLYRKQSQAHANRLLDQAKQQLHQGHAPETVLENLTEQLTKTLTHAPSTLLRRAASDGDVDTLNTAIKELQKPHRYQKLQQLDDHEVWNDSHASINALHMPNKNT